MIYYKNKTERIDIILKATSGKWNLFLELTNASNIDMLLLLEYRIY